MVHRAHEPVLVRETLALLEPYRTGIFIDATLGAGGHAEALLEAGGPGVRVIGIDRDPTALAIARSRLSRFGAAFVALRGDYRNLRELLAEAGESAVDGMLFDLGVSSMQLDDPERGFSFQTDGPLDMRMDPEAGPSAAELLASLPEEELSDLLWRFGDERHARRIARAIAQQRLDKPLTRTRELAILVERALGHWGARERIHPATRTFQALRIAVNGEVEGLEEFVPEAMSLLRPGGRAVWIAFHSLEDRAVKRALRSLSLACTCPSTLPVCGCGKKSVARILTPKPVRPSTDEMARNPRSRSARLRAAERL